MLTFYQDAKKSKISNLFLMFITKLNLVNLPYVYTLGM